jgi:hypothetical protein
VQQGEVQSEERSATRKSAMQSNQQTKLSNRAEQYKKKSKLINRNTNQTNRDKQYPNQQRIQQSTIPINFHVPPFIQFVCSSNQRRNPFTKHT